MTSSELADHDSAVARISFLYQAGVKSTCDSIDNFIACGHQLREIRDSLPHGEWLLWVKAHQAELGFSPRTAQRLMTAAKNANTTLASHLSTDEISAYSRLLWGHDAAVDPHATDAAPTWIGFERFLKWAEAHSPAVLAISDPAAVYAQIALARQWLERLETSIAATRRAA